jgi:murein DD-endopeptidase MepM/ murein hydrolase activator NlpD
MKTPSSKTFIHFLTITVLALLLTINHPQTKHAAAQNQHKNAYGMGLDLDWYCSNQHGSQARLALHDNNPDGFQCKVNENSFRIDMNHACTSMYGSEYRAELGDRNSVGSWYCTDSKVENRNLKTIPLLQSPVRQTPYTANPFDHSKGIWPEDNDDVMILYTGQVIKNARRKYHADGHKGYDWGMPWGTELLATADGTISFSGTTEPYYCALNGTQVRDITVHIDHTTPSGERFRTIYSHISEVLVKDGETVRAGQPVALSGGEPIGCSGGQLLHFSVMRLTNTNNGKPTDIDPYGWQGDYDDPWENSPDGAPSLWLWKPGQAPKLRNRLW